MLMSVASGIIGTCDAHDATSPSMATSIAFWMGRLSEDSSMPDGIYVFIPYDQILVICLLLMGILILFLCGMCLVCLRPIVRYQGAATPTAATTGSVTSGSHSPTPLDVEFYHTSDAAVQSCCTYRWKEVRVPRFQHRTQGFAEGDRVEFASRQSD